MWKTFSQQKHISKDVLHKCFLANNLILLKEKSLARMFVLCQGDGYSSEVINKDNNGSEA